MPVSAYYILAAVLIGNWVRQLVVIYTLPESHFQQPGDRILWFNVVLVLVPVGAVVFLWWNHERTKKVRADRRHLEQRERIARRADDARRQEPSPPPPTDQ